MKKTENDPTKALARAAEERAHAKYVLKLYVAGVTQRSRAAIKAVTEAYEEHLKGRYELEIIDVYMRPTLAKGEQILATPTLIKQLPLPLKKVIGNMASQDRLLVGLDLRPKDET